jgi:ubiquinone/menaquinone biosynthesis C-methylase UbiE
LEKENLPFDDGMIDVVFTKSVIEHIANPFHFISECKRVLKDGGKIIVMSPDWKSTMYLFYEDYTHIRPYTSISLKNLLLSHNFDKV